MNISLLSTLLAHSPSCCFPQHITPKEDYYKWRLETVCENNSKFSSQLYSYSTTLQCMKEDFNHKTQKDFNHKTQKSGKRGFN